MNVSYPKSNGFSGLSVRKTGIMASLQSVWTLRGLPHIQEMPMTMFGMPTYDRHPRNGHKPKIHKLDVYLGFVVIDS